MVPVAGRSSRLKELTGGGPKALLEIEGRPLLGWLLESLSSFASDICLVVDRSDSSIQQAFGARWHRQRLHYAVQPVPRGVGDAILRSSEFVTGPFITVMGDVFFDQPLDGYVEAWRRSGAEGAVLTEPIHSPPPDRIGLVRVEEGFVVRIEKDEFAGQAADRVCGMAILPEAAFEVGGCLEPRSGPELELEDIVDRLMREGRCRFVALPYAGWRRNVNSSEDLEAVRLRVNQDQ